MVLPRKQHYALLSLKSPLLNLSKKGDTVAQDIVIRLALPEDEVAIVELENRVWEPLGCPTITSDTFHLWLQTYNQGFLVAATSNAILGFAYHEIVCFDPRNAGYHMRRLLRAGFRGKVHDPQKGNAFYGVTISTHPPDMGVGKLLLQKALCLARQFDLEYILTFARMPGLQKFIKNRAKDAKEESLSRKALALRYAIRSVQLAGGSLGEDCSGVELPRSFLEMQTPDPVVGRFVRLMGMQLEGVSRSAFSDPESAHHAAFMVRYLNEEFQRVFSE